MRPCPAVDELYQLAKGHLDQATAQALSEHVETCRACQAALDTLPAFGDSNCPGYEIEGELGRGGMGVVYKARQLSLNRLVAIKMMLAGAHSSRDELLRFRAEAETVARLRHPNIVQIHEVGESEGRLFLVLEMVEGPSLAQKYGGTPQEPAVAVPLVRTLAEAVHFAHREGIVHRDLKPANVLLTVEGTPKLTDFGLAKRLDAVGLTQSGALLGTPCYMAPEQASGHASQIGPATDVHALGAILYELLTGRPPFQAANVLETLEQVRTQEPVALRRLQPRLPRDLETICLKCLRKEPAQRYASAEALAEDLRRFENREPILARPVSLWERGIKSARRRPALAALLVLLSLTVLGVPLALLGHNRQLSEAKEIADANRQRAEDEAERTRQLLYLDGIERARDLLRSGDVFTLADVLDRHRPAAEDSRDRRGFEWYYYAQFAQRPRPVLRDHPTSPFLLAYSPDGELLVRANHLWVTAWDRSSGRRRYSLLLPGLSLDRRTAALSHDGQTLAVLDSKNPKVVAIHDARTGKEKRRRRFPAPIDHLAFLGGARKLVVQFEPASQLWDWESPQPPSPVPWSPANASAVAAPTGQVVAALQQEGLHLRFLAEKQAWAEPRSVKDLASLAFSARARWLALGFANGTVELGHLPDVSFEILRGHLVSVTAVAFSPDERVLASGDHAGNVRLWDVQARQTRGLFRWQSATIRGLAFAPDGRELAVAIGDGTVHRINADIPPSPLPLRTVCPLPRSVAFAPDGRTLAVTSGDGSVHLARLTAGEALPPLDGHPAEVKELSFSANGRTLATLDIHGHAVRLWDVTGGRVTAILKRNPPSPAHLLALAPSGRRLATAHDREVVLWDPATGRKHVAWTAHGARISALVWVADGSLLATAGHDRSVRLWDPTLWRAGAKPALKADLLHDGPLHDLTVSRDGQVLAALEQASDGRQIRIWNIGKSATPPKQKPWKVPGSVRRVRFVAGTRTLLTVDEKDLFIWDTGGKVQAQLATHLPQLWHDAAPSPDGRHLATVDNSGAVHLWDLETWEARLPLGSPIWPVRSLALAPDKRGVIVGSAIPRPLVKIRKRSGFAGLKLGSEVPVQNAPLRSTSDSVQLWDLGDGRKSLSLPGRPTMAPPEYVAVSPDGRRMAGGATDGSIWVWDLVKRLPLRRLFVSEQAKGYVLLMELGRRIHSAWPEPAEGVEALDFAPDSRTLAVASSKGTITFWDVDRGKITARLPESHRGFRWLRFTPDGKSLALAEGGYVRLWDPKTAALQAVFGSIDDSAIFCGAFSADGKLLASGTEKGPIRLWDLSSGREHPPLTGHHSRVTALAFSLDGRTLASGSWDRTVRLWNLATNQAVGELEGHRGAVTCLLFTRDGRELISGGEFGAKGEVLRWRTSQGDGWQRR